MQMIVARMVVPGMTVLVSMIFDVATFFELAVFMFPASRPVRVSVSVTMSHRISAVRKVPGLTAARY